VDNHLRSAVRRANVNSYFTRLSREYPTHRFLSGPIGLVYQRQVAEIAVLMDDVSTVTSTLAALDWGCGKGHITYLLKQEGYRVTSCDIVSGQSDSSFSQDVPILQELGVSVVPLLDPVSIPFENKSFDLVTSFGVLEHVSNDSASLAEISRILKPNGVFYCSFLPYKWSWTQRLARLLGDGYHDRLYTKKHVRSIFRANGLSIIKLRHGQLFPKNFGPQSAVAEALDSFLCRFTPLRYFGTNLVVIARRTNRQAPLQKAG
jgi:SAM-dependent methyltransferase